MRRLAHFLNRSISSMVLPKRQSGDTIVEVLIAAAIVSLVIASAYALTNKNVLSMQNAQEQQYAQKLVQQQVEQLRAATTKPTTSGCFVGGAYLTPYNATDCTITTSSGLEYVLKIENTAVRTYTVQSQWQTLGGSDAKVTVYYRVP